MPCPVPCQALRFKTAVSSFGEQPPARACVHTHTHFGKTCPLPGELRGRGGGSSALACLCGETWLWPPLAFFPLLAWGGAGAAEGLLLHQGWCQGACPLPCLSPSPELPCPSPQRAPCFHFPHPATPPLNSLLPAALSPCCLPCPRLLFFPPCLFLPPTCPNPEPALFREPLQMQWCSGFTVAWTWRGMAIFSLQPSAA